MHWSSPEQWWWLGLLPALGVFWAWASRSRQRSLRRVADASLVPALTTLVDWTSRRIKTGLIAASILFVIVALAGPQWGFRWQEIKRRGVDIVIALDVSNSMLAEDVKPNRLERAKLAIQDFVKQLEGDRVALVAFAGTSFVQCPLTADYDAFLLTLEEVDTRAIPRGGTALTAAIRESLKVLRDAASSSKTVVLISDGESHEGDTMTAAQEAVRAGVTIHAIGIGTSQGELVPVVDERGERRFLKDREGRTVKSRLDEATLQQIARATGGGYMRATSTAFGLDRLYRERIAKLPEHELESSMKKQYELRFQWPLAIAFVLLALEPLLADRNRAGFSP